MSSGAQLILKERLRQISEEGWSKAHDDEHVGQEMLGAARAYAIVAQHQQEFKKWIISDPPASWPYDWDIKWWKPSKDPKRNLVKAGALIAAEIDRLLRKEENDRTIGN